MIYTDSIFKIGSSHEVCEDYAYSSEKFAGISDGCSGAYNTDVGARLLLHSAYSRTLDRESDPNPIPVTKTICPTHLSDSLYATLLYTWIDRDYINVKFQGDGFVATRHNNLNRWRVVHREFFSPSGESMPQYPIYRSDDDYFNAGIRCDINYLTIESGKVISDEKESVEVSHKLALWDLMNFHPSFSDTILVGSDGWSTFPIPFKEVIADLLSFKNFKGEFIKRRVNAQLKKWNMEHFDDISLAGISVQ